MATHRMPPYVTREEYFEENRRYYGTFRRGCYILPCDESEMDRLDVMHTLFKTVRERERRLIHAPFREKPPSTTGERSRVLDLGCGTGIWLLEMAEVFPQAELLGIDLNRMGPEFVLDNVDIRVPVDYESPWTLGEASWDLIHMQMGLGSVSMWRQIYQKIFRHLVPGTGWFESVEIDFEPRCDDGTLTRLRRPGTNDAGLIEWYEYISQAYAACGRRIEYNPNTEAELQHVGFKDIHHSVYRLPLNPWVPENTDKPQHRAGNWYNIAMSSLHEGHGCHGLEAMTMAPLTRFNNWPAEHVKRMCSDAMQQASHPGVHAYNLLHVIIARRPYPDEPT